MLNFFTNRSTLKRSVIKGKKKAKPQERFLQTCQWQVPSTWDGDPLSDFGAASFIGNIKNQLLDNDNGSVGISLSGDSEQGGYLPQDAHDGGSAFQEPRDSWVPGGDFSLMEEDKTPGIR